MDLVSRLGERGWAAASAGAGRLGTIGGLGTVWAPEAGETRSTVVGTDDWAPEAGETASTVVGTIG